MTDFGYRDPYVAIMKGVIARINPEAVMIDGPHDLPAFKITSAAYAVYNMYKWYPPDTVFTIVVDPGVGTQRRSLVVHAGGYWFIAPDNGILYPIVEGEATTAVYAIVEDKLNKAASIEAGLKEWGISYTFHGRDVYAPAAALISLYGKPGDWAKPMGARNMVRRSLFWKKRRGNNVRYKVVNVDRFGNVALSELFARSDVREAREAVLKMGDRSWRVRRARTFGEVPRGDMIFYENSFGFLELGVNQGSAAERLGLDVDDEVELVVI